MILSLDQLPLMSEAEDGLMTDVIRARLRAAYEAAGVEFTNGGQPGVRMKGEATGARAVIAKGAEARGKAKTAVDEALADVDAGHEEKAARKQKLTSVPKELKSK